MHLYNLTLQKATGITNVIHGNFSGTKQQEIVIARGKIIEILKYDPNTGKVYTILRIHIYSCVYIVYVHACMHVCICILMQMRLIHTCIYVDLGYNHIFVYAYTCIQMCSYLKPIYVNFSIFPVRSRMYAYS